MTWPPSMEKMVKRCMWCTPMANQIRPVGKKELGVSGRIALKREPGLNGYPYWDQPHLLENSSTHFCKKKYSYSINRVSGTVTYTYV